MKSVFGSTGFVGGVYSRMYEDQIIRIPRESRNPESNNIVYFLSTNTNYNIFEDVHLDVFLSSLLDVQVRGPQRFSRARVQKSTPHLICMF